MNKLKNKLKTKESKKSISTKAKSEKEDKDRGVLNDNSEFQKIGNFIIEVLKTIYWEIKKNPVQILYCLIPLIIIALAFIVVTPKSNLNQ